jgi:hypothetical protein
MILCSLVPFVGGVAIAVGAVVAAVAAVAVAAGTWPPDEGRPLAMLFVVPLFVCGLYFASFAPQFWLAAFGERLLLTNPETGQIWRRRTIWTLEVDRGAVGDLQSLELSPDCDVRLHYPASVATLFNGQSERRTERLAADVFAAAVLSLVNQRQLRLFTAASYRSVLGLPLSRSRDEFIVACGHSVDTEGGNGVLEKLVVQAVANWAACEEAKEWPKGPNIYELVRGMYEKQCEYPSHHILDIVAGDAVSRGLGAKRSAWDQAFKQDLNRLWEPVWDARFGDGLRVDHELVKTFVSQLEAKMPGIMAMLADGITRGIASQQDSSS